MSQENVEVFKRAIEAFNRSGSFDAVLEEVHPEVEWHAGLKASLVGKAGAVHRGREGAREMSEELLDAFTDIHFEISEIRDLGDRLLALGRIHARGAESGAEIESPYAFLARFKNRKAIWVRSYVDLDEALEAAGLSE